MYVGGLPRTLDNRGLYNLFKNEGRLTGCQIMYDRLGNSRGFGNIEFKNPIDALRTIRRWNNTKFMGLTLRVEYQKRIEILIKALLIGEETSITIIEIIKILMEIQEGIINQHMKEMEPLDGLKI